MKMFLIGIAGLLLIASQTSRPRGKMYTIDPTQSTIAVTIFQAGFLGKIRPSHAIGVKSFTGWMQMTSGKEAQSTAELIAEAKSLYNNEPQVGDLERREFENALRNVVLEAPKFPQIIFRSTSITDMRSTGQEHTFKLHGDLTMHGVTRKISLPVVVTVGKGQLRATGEVVFKQSDYEMKPYEAAFGLIKIRDDVKVAFTIIAKTGP